MRPISKRHFFVFGLIFIFTITFYFAILFYPKPDVIRWKTYSTNEMNTDLQNNKIVLISVMASWTHGTLFHEYAFIRQPSVEKIILSKNISCYRVDLEKIPKDQIRAWRDFLNDGSGLGMILLKIDSNNKTTTRITLRNKMSVKKVISEIESISKEHIERSKGTGSL